MNNNLDLKNDLISLLKYRELDYFENRENEMFVFELINPLIRIAKLITQKSTFYFDYTAYKLKATTAPCIALSELNGLMVYHKDIPQSSGKINGFYGLNKSQVGVVWDSGKGTLKLPSTYFWNDLNDLKILL